VYAVIYSANKSLKKEEFKSNKALAKKIAAIIKGIEIPICNIECDLKKDYKKIFNLCDNNENTGSGFLESVLFLEKNKFTFTGASSKILYFFVNKQRWIERLYKLNFLPKNSFFCKDMPTPVILKSACKHGSEEITMKNILCKYPSTIKKDCYLEEFIDGDEFSYCEVPGLFSVSVKKEISKNRICDYNFKWRKHKQENLQISKDKKIYKIAKLIKKKFNIKSYYRIDYRIKNNKIYVFDINLNCYLGEDGTLVKAAKLCGHTFKDVIDKIFY